MRTEREMADLILGVARGDERIRAVFLNGSRTNIHAPRDPFQDYDVVYMVEDVREFRGDDSWIRVFGEELIFQFPDESSLFPEEPEKRYHYLMQFADGNRIDLTLLPTADLDEYLGEDKLTVLLLDKDGRVGELPPPTDEDYRVRRPSEREYMDCCNEFYWVSNYTAKGLWREEIPYAHETLDRYVRDMLNLMLGWRVGVDTDFSVSVGKSGKYLKNYLPPELYARMLRTYAGGETEQIWDALETMQELFRDCALAVGTALGYEFPRKWHDNVTRFCRHIRTLPKDAKEIW